MNEPETNSPAPEEQSDVAASFRHQMTLMLLALIVISGTLTTYLFYQSHVLGRDLAGLQPQAKLVVDNFQRNLPRVQKFVQEMVVYGQKHPDFQPILKKYGIPLTLSAPTNSAALPKVSQPPPLKK